MVAEPPVVFLFVFCFPVDSLYTTWMRFGGTHKENHLQTEVFLPLTRQGLSSGDDGTEPECRNGTGHTHNYPSENLDMNQMSNNRELRK